MERAFTAQGSHRYIDILPDLMRSYNNSFHRSIGMKPRDVKPTHVSVIMKRLYPKETTRKTSKFKVGDNVRITRKHRTFQKGYEQKWSYEVFYISKVNVSKPVTYTLRDYKSEAIIGNFYSRDIQKVDKTNNIFPIERVINKRQKHRKIEYFVKFVGYPSEANSWIPQEDLFSV